MEFDQAESETNLELANIIIRESNRLTDTIGEFLKFARPEQPNFEWVSLHECVDEVLAMLRAAKQFPESATVEFDFDKNIAIWSDEKQLFTLFSHLLDNAIPFCPKGKERLYIKAEEISDDVEGLIQLSVSDNGTGIGKESLHSLFEPFYTTRADGTGLGLAIVWQIIQDHQAYISVANTGLRNEAGGRGASFIIGFPLPEL